MSFFTEYFGIAGDQIETPVCCPFEHFTSNGHPYQETHESAHVNTMDNLFHCKVCGKGYSEAQFIQAVLQCKFPDAKRIQRAFETIEDRNLWLSDTTSLNEETKQRCLNLGMSEKVIEELDLLTAPGTTDHIAFPVFMFNHLLDARVYNPGGSPKVRSRANCPSGLIIPFDIWKDTIPSLVTVLCAGEKDMAIARSFGFNAITLTGGENTTPRQLSYFKDRYVVICYDNDGAGITGAQKIASELLKVTKSVKVITNFHEGMEEHEDITDYFIKYRHTKDDLVSCMKSTPIYIPPVNDISRGYPIMDLLQASRPENLNKMVQSNVQVVAIAETTFACPTSILAEKFKETQAGDSMKVGDIREWELSENNAQDILHMIDNNFREDIIQKNIRDILRILQKERYVSIKTLQQATVFKCFVTDMFETADASTTQPMEYTAYSLTNKLESGQKYLATYKIVPHPYKGQQLIMIITDAKQANDSVTNFKLTENIKASLQTIIDIQGPIPDKIHILIEKVKGLLGYDGNNQLIEIIDLAFHTPLQFHFGHFQNIRAYLDTIIVGESRTGKSSTADALRKIYGLGTFTSLAGNSATIPGLVGGSNKTANGYQTRAGIIPQNHRGLVIFEEFGKSNNSVITELTDIRSSNEVRITRVAGTITLPAMVRMISLTNPKNVGGQIKSVASYPNGIAVLTELVTSAEDIARYDLICVLADKGNSKIDPDWKPETPLDTRVYRDRIRWIWSRTADQILIDRSVELHIIERSNTLNKTYEGHIKIFGTEAWKKISRLAIAIAGYVVSTDASYENIIVKKEHVDLAEKILVSLYDNSTFKLKEYIAFEKQFTHIDEEGVALLQDIYDKTPMLILQLEQSASTGRQILLAATGLTTEEMNKALTRMTKGLFVKYNNYDIVPTERFRLGLARINKKTFVSKVGEVNVEI